MPREYEALRMRDRFGDAAVFGGAVSPGFLRRMAFCERVAQAHESRGESSDWATWAEKHREENNLLNWCIKVAANGE